MQCSKLNFGTKFALLLQKFTLTFTKIQFIALYVKHLIIAVSMSKSKNPSLVPMRDNAVVRWLRSVAV